MAAAGRLTVLTLVVFYLIQFITLPPNHADGGLLLDYIHLMSEGKLPFWDFIDLYGPIHWLFPVLFYQLADQQVWGIRVWLLILKLISIVLAFRLVERLAGRLLAWLCGLWMTVLLGAPWQLLQTPYAMHTCLALLLGVWYLLLTAFLPRNEPRTTLRELGSGAIPGTDASSAEGRDARHDLRSLRRIAAAGLLTGVAIWTKVNTGAFLFAGGLFYCFYWLPVGSVRGPSNEGGGRWPSAFRLAQLAGLLVYGLVFVGFVRSHLTTLYFGYLVLPLAMVLGVSALKVIRGRLDRGRAQHHLRAWFTYLVSTSLFTAGFFLAYYGVSGGLEFLSETATIVSHLDYDAPFPPLGEPLLQVGLNEYHWPQLPWLVTAVFAVGSCLAWLRLDDRHSLLERPGTSVWTGLFALLTFQAFVTYSRADEAHLIQAVWPAVPALFALLAPLVAVSGRPSWLLGGIAVAALWMARSLAVPPTLDALFWGPGDWHGRHLRHLRFQPAESPYVRDFSAQISNFDWDVAANRAAEHIDRVTEDGEQVLVSSRNELLTYNSHTTSVGGRYRYLFYLLRHHFIDRDAFFEIVPVGAIEGLRERPPRVIASVYGAAPLYEHLPELGTLMMERYILSGKYRHILIYERKNVVETRSGAEPADGQSRR